MIVIPRWAEQPDDTALFALTMALLGLMKSSTSVADIRLHTQAITETMQRYIRDPDSIIGADIRRTDSVIAEDIELTSDEGSSDECESRHLDTEHSRELLQQHSDFKQAELVEA